MEYTAVVRTLGKAHDKYKILLDSLQTQTLRPAAVLVYIAEGYPLPPEASSFERYIYVKKGMVAQRALPYHEVSTEWILFLDDDVYLPPRAVETLFQHLNEQKADIASPDVFHNCERNRLSRLQMALSGRMMGRKDDSFWAYKVLRTGGYSYNLHPTKGAYFSQTNAGPCFLCRKADFLEINFNEEIWIEQCKYAQGEDQIMFYKMYCYGLKQLTVFDSGIIHLDAGTTNSSAEKLSNVLYSDLFFKVVFWHRFIFLRDSKLLMKVWDLMCIGYLILFTLLVSCLKFQFRFLCLKFQALCDACRYISSSEYFSLTKIP